MSASPTAPPTRGPRLIVTMLLALILLAAVITLLDRRLLTEERNDLQGEIARLHGRLEAASDVLGLRLEVQELKNQSEAQRRSLVSARLALDMLSSGQSFHRVVLKSAGIPNVGSGWVILPEKGYQAFAVFVQLRELPAGSEFVVVGRAGTRDVELARFVPVPDQSAFVTLSLPSLGPSISKIWLKVAGRGEAADGTPLLYWDGPVAGAPESGRVRE